MIKYKEGYKYQLAEDYTVEVPISNWDIDTGYIKLTKTGHLTIKRGYAWDGPSGPTIDTHDFMRGALVHDALYQLMRETDLHKNTYREIADRTMRWMCQEDGMGWFRAWYCYYAVRFFGDKAASREGDYKIKTAPKGK